MTQIARDVVSNSFDLGSFRRRLEEAMEGISRYAVAKKSGISDGAVKKYLDGVSIPSIDRAMALAEATGVNLLWLVSGEGPKYPHQASDTPAPSPIDKDVVWVDSFDVFASAGNGAHNDWDHLDARAPFAKDWLRAHDLEGKKLAALKVHGDSMHPTLDHGDTVLVELLADDAVDHLTDGIYVLRLNGNLLVKRLQSDLMGGLYIKSDNPAYDKIHLTQSNKPDDIKVIARWTEKKI